MAMDYLSINNGKYQHSFYSNPKNKNKCLICGHKMKEHIEDVEKTITYTNNKMNNSINSFSFIHEHININEKSNNIKEDYTCKICFDKFKKKEINICENCNVCICHSDLFEYFKTLIKEGKQIKCTDCDSIFDEDIIFNTLSKFCNDNEEYENLKQFYHKNEITFLVSSNP